MRRQTTASVLMISVGIVKLRQSLADCFNDHQYSQIKLKFHISVLDSVSDKCEDLSLLVKHSDSYRFTESSKISSGSDVTYCSRPPIGSCKIAPLRFGAKQPVPVKIQTPFHHSLILIASVIKLTGPTGGIKALFP